MSLEIAKMIAQLIPSDSIEEIKKLMSPYSLEQRRFIVSTDVSGSSVLFNTILHRSSSLVKYFLEECGADPNSFGSEQYGKRTCLTKAVSLDSKIMVEILLRQGADINGVSFGYQTALATACFHNNLEMTKFLVENGANTNIQNNNESHSLMPPYSDCELAEYLVENGANINMVDEHGNTLLMQAVMMNDKETISFLLSFQDVDIRIKNQYNEDALSLAIYFCSDDIIRTIIKRACYTKEEVIRAFELKSYFEYIHRRHPKSIALWQKSLGLQDFPTDTPMFKNFLPNQESDKDIILFREHDRQALMHMRTLYGTRHVLTLRVTAIALSFVYVRQNFLEIFEGFSKILHSLNCKEFLQIHPHMENIFKVYTSNFSGEAASFKEFFKILSDYTIIFRAKHQQPMTPSTRNFYATISEEFQDYLIKLMSFLKNRYKSSIYIIYKKIKKFIKTHLKNLTSRSLAKIILERKKFSIFEICLSCGDDVNKTDDNNETILHYLLDSEISRKRELIKLVVDAGFDFSRVTSTKYCLPCRMKKENIFYYPKECNTLQCLAANVICQKTVFWANNVPTILRTIIKTHMHIP